MRRAVLIGLDGATWSVIGPYLEDGTMPHLAELLGRAAHGSLRSTIPAYTPPAWTSAATGVNPGRHGIFGFVQGRGAPRLVNWSLVSAPAVWQYLSRGGATTGLFHVPLTYPPPRIDGWAVGAVWMPTARDVTGFAHPADVERRIADLVPGYAAVSGVNVFEDWRGTDLADRVASVVRDRRLVLADLLEDRPVDLVWAVLEAPDRLHHAYYKYLDPEEDLASTVEGARVRRSCRAVFAAIDTVIGLLDAYAGPEGVALVCSDHGATGWHGYVYGNTLLERAGLLHLRPAGRLLRFAGLGRLGSLARKVVPARVAYRARRAARSLIEPGRTRAYTARLGSQGFAVNLAGREPLGSVPSGQFEAARESLQTVLRGTRTPGGEAMFPAIHRREDLYQGPEAGEAPDLVVETAGSRWEVSDAVGERNVLRDLSDLPLGCHHPDGVLAVRANGVDASQGIRANIVDVAPTLLYAMGAPVPEGLDGEARRDLFGPSAPAIVTAPAAAIDRSAVDGYSPEEEAQITEYLANLGYV
jgi:predicted AlkP superfamily phosphohydrolase/phosphomutase